MNPRLLSEQMPIADQLELQMRQQQLLGNAGKGGSSELGNTIEGEVADEQMGGGSMESTPVGLVPNSPNSALVEGVA
jgi:hypothetical protein